MDTTKHNNGPVNISVYDYNPDDHKMQQTYWVDRKVKKNVVWHLYLSFPRVYLGFLYDKRKLFKRQKNVLHEEPSSFNYTYFY